MAKAALQIGKVSAQTGLSVDAIRFYEKQGLLERAQRTGGGFRLFTAHDIHRIEFIQNAQKLGFSLPEIRELLLIQGDDSEKCCHVLDLLEAKLLVVRRKLSQLRGLEQQLTKSLRKCQRQLRAGNASHNGSCPVLNALAHRGLDES